MILKQKDIAINLFKKGELAVRDNEELAYTLLLSNLAGDKKIPIKLLNEESKCYNGKLSASFEGDINPGLYSRITKFFVIEHSSLRKN